MKFDAQLQTKTRLKLRPTKGLNGSRVAWPLRGQCVSIEPKQSWAKPKRHSINGNNFLINDVDI